MSYDDTVERLAIAVASHIKTVDDYHQVMNSLEKIKSKNMYAITMIDLVNKYTDREIVEKFHREVDRFVNKILDKDEIDQEKWLTTEFEPLVKKRKKTSLLTKVLSILKRRK